MLNTSQIFADNGLSIIFNGALIPNSSADSVNPYEVIGYRHEQIKSENVKVHSRSKKDTKGIYRATTFYNGVRRRARSNKSLFFPAAWMMDDVIKAITEAYQNGNFTELPNSRFAGQTSDGMNICLWLDENKKVFDAMPLSDELKRKWHKRRHKFCRECGKPKQTICLDHYCFPKKKKSFLRRIRYYSRKFYFGFARRLGFVD